MKNINAMKNINSFIKSHCGFGGISSVSRRYLVLLTALLSLGVGNAWGDDPNTSHTINNPHFYYYNSADWANCMVLYGRGWDNANWTDGYNLDPVTGTKLYYAKIAVNWNNTYNQIAVLNAEKSGNNWKGEGNAIESRWSYATDHTDNVVWNYDLVSPKIFLWDGKSASSITWISDSESDYTKLNHSQTVYKYTSTDNGSSYSAASVNSGTVTISAYKMTGNGTASNTSNSATINTAATTSASKDAAYTGEVTLTASANTGYTFVGWFDVASGGSVLSTSAEYTYNAPNSTKSIYARFQRDTYTITYNNMTGATNHVSNPSNYNVASGAITLQAPTKTGYIFEGWYSNSELTTPATTIAAGSTGNKVFYAKWTAITVSATVSPSSGVEGANNLTFSISSNVPTNSGYYVAVYNFGESDYSSGYINGDKVFSANPTSYTCTTPSLSTGTVYTRVIIIKDAVVQATSDKIAFTVASASDPSWSMYNDATKLGDFTNNGDGSHSLVVTIPAGGYSLLHYNNDQGFVGATGAESLTTERSLVNNNGRIAWQDGAGTFRITIRKDGSTWKIKAVKVYTVTYDDNGATSGSVPTDANYYTSGSTVTVKTNSGSLAKTGYTFGGWNTNTLGTGTNYTAGTGTFSITEDKILYAKWNETIHTVTVDRNNTTLGTVNTTSVNAGASTASSTITATPVSGATFTGWTIPSGVTLASGTESSQSITIYATADKTITANFSETTYTVNVALAVAAQSNGTTSPNGDTQVGAITPVQITAPTPKTGYLSTGRWTTTGGVTVATPTANPTTITATSNGTVSWTFDEDLTTIWYLTGSFNEWSATANKFTKKTGESTGNVAYTTIDLAANTTYTFGVNDGTTYYSNNNTTDAPAYYIKGTVEDWTFVSGLDYGVNCGMVSTLAGTYTFKIDFSGSNPKVSVYYPEIYAISGSFNSWTESNNLEFTGNDGSYSVSIDGSATNYEFKVLDNAVWYGASKTFTGTESNVSVTSGGANINLTADVYPSGTYNFAYNKSTHKLGVTYPTSYVVNYGMRTGGSTVTAKIDNTTAFDSGTKIAPSTSVTFSQTAATGYTFEGWYNAASGGSKLSSEASYTTTISAATTVYANYTENTYNVATYNNGNGNTSPEYASAGIVTAPSFTATPATGYYFIGWEEKDGSVLTINSPTELTTTVNASNAGTLQANFTQQWAIVGTEEIGGWEDFTKVLDTYEVVATKDKGYIDITLEPNKTYLLKVYDKKNDAWYGYASGDNDENQIHYAVGDVEKAVTNATGNRDLYLNTGAQGTYHFKWNLTDKKLAIEYPTSRFFTIGKNIDEAGTVTAVDGQNYPITTGQAIRDNGSITFTITTVNTGYEFSGWYSNEACTTPYTHNGSTIVINESAKTLQLTNVTAELTKVYAKFTPKTYPITLTQTGAKTEGSTSATATYNAVLPAITKPTPADGYAFMGYFTAADGAGTQFTDNNGAWIAGIENYTDANKKWIQDDGITLYAYFKQAEITNLTLSSGIVAPGASVTATPTIAPSPEAGSTILCWKILRSNGNLLTKEGFTPGEGNSVSFNAPATGGTYKVVCVLHTGSSCDGGTELDTKEVDLVVASAHSVTIRYQDSDGRTLAPSQEIAGRPLDWTEETITPAAITGYSFARWDAGDGVIISTDKSAEVSTTTTAAIYMKANYDGTLTAVYSKKNVIYFNNTLGWSDVWVYFYTNNKYWADNFGTGAYKGKYFDSTYPYNGMMHGHMTQIEGTNIWYFDYTAAGYGTYENIAFANMDKSNSGTDNTSNNDLGFFSNTTSDPIQVVRRGDHKASLPMFVPLAGQPKTKLNNDKAEYSNQGYWMNYPENTGYTLKIYNGTGGSEATLQSIPFEFTANKTLPMELTVELDASRTYGFEIYRADGQYLGISGTTFKKGDSGDEGETVRATETSGRTGLKTSVAGDYIFKLNFGKNSDSYKYLLGVHYPIATNDYRIVYTETGETLWSGNTKPANWYHPSRAIEKKEGAEDIVSFYVKKDAASMKFQYAKAINAETGVVTWEDVAGGTIDLSDITSSGVYNFTTTQTDGSISVTNIAAYTGNYYIRTDLAGTTGWDNYRAPDHQMTYTEFSKDRSTNKFGELYTHYYMKWCERGKNIKFVIANDYSSCISDTLESDITDLGNMTSPGWLNSDEAADPVNDKFSANIRFMYDERTNKITRAYMSSSTNTSRKFLVLKGNAAFWNSNGTALSGSGESSDAGTNNWEAIFKDNENWIYEREIKVTPGTLFKLYACYAQNEVSENGAQHFRGTYADGAFTKDESAVELIGGTGGTCNARLIYDFKTNRLIAAYLPDGSEIDGTKDIDADLMIIREHQEAGQQLTFKDDEAKLTDVYTVYGVMRFNRWILNNRANPTDHAKDHSDTDAHISEHHPLLAAGSQKSASERNLYWISFPFDVNLSEVFGFGTYGTHWVMMRYNGEERAKQGFWAESEGFWEYIWDRNGVVLKGGMGYVLALDLDLMQATDRTFWSNDIQQVELYFPSTSNAGTIKQTTATVEVPEYKCTIDRTGNNGSDINKNRTKVDSDWNIIGVPSYANYGTALTDEGGTVTWKDNSALNWTNDLPFLYEWNANDNTYTVQSGSTYPFKAMHAYYVQYHGTLTWSLASATPSSSIVARRTYANAPQSEEFRLEILRNDKKEDQTFVKLSNDEEVSANFVVGEDLTKEKNANKANIYTIVENYLPIAGNTLPMSDQTTVVPLGVTTNSTGEYTFAMPDGTSGVGVTLIDNVENTRTNLSALDYTVTLTAGEYTNRFFLEISPVQNTPTDIEAVSGQPSEVRKVMIDGILYIVRDLKR